MSSTKWIVLFPIPLFFILYPLFLMYYTLIPGRSVLAVAQRFHFLAMCGPLHWDAVFPWRGHCFLQKEWSKRGQGRSCCVFYTSPRKAHTVISALFLIRGNYTKAWTPARKWGSWGPSRSLATTPPKADSALWWWIPIILNCLPLLLASYVFPNSKLFPLKWHLKS